jgi:hypothetical protein
LYVGTTHESPVLNVVAENAACAVGRMSASDNAPA